MTPAQIEAYNWLIFNGGSGIFDIKGRVIANGVKSRFPNSTWATLRKLKKVEFYNPHSKGYGNIRIVGNVN